MNTIRNMPPIPPVGTYDVIDSLKKGIIKIGQESSYVLHAVYSNDGFEKICSFSLSAFKALDIKGPMVDCFKWQKTWYNVSKFLGSLGRYFKLDDKNRYHFTLPERRSFDEPVYRRDQRPNIAASIRPWYARIDFFAINMDIANFFETGKFIQTNMYSFPTLQKVATQVGSYQVPVFNKQFDQIFLLQSLCDRPKELFVVAGSTASLFARVGAAIMEIGKPVNPVQNPAIAYVKNKSLSLSNLMGIAGDIGRISLVVLSRHYADRKWFNLGLELPLRTIGVIKFIYDREIGRQDRKFYTGV